MQNFIEKITMEAGFNAEFHFNRVYTISGFRYFISVLDKKRHSFFFQMEQKSHKWKICNAPKMPAWIMNAEQKLAAAIEGRNGS